MSGSGAPRIDLITPEQTTEPAVIGALLGLWTAVTDAGGAVGFSAPADHQAHAVALDAELRTVRSRRDALLVSWDDDQAIGMGFLRSRGNPLFDHWRTVMRLMVHPDRQGCGEGERLLLAVHDHARSLGCEHLQLTVRDGEGLDRFYERFGYREVGRHPGSVRMAAGDDRDELMLVARLDGIEP